MLNRLYVTDLDGTLLNFSGKLSEYSVGALNFLLEKNVNITFATARSYHSLAYILEAVNNKLPVITFNGGHISNVVTGKHLITNCLNDKTAKSLYNDIEEYGVLVSCYENEEDVLKFNEAKTQGMKQYILDREEMLETKILKFNDFENKSIMGYTIIDEKEKLVSLKKNLLEKFDDINIELWEDMYYKPWYWLSINSCLATKGQMLKTLRNMVEEPFDEVIAFGDQENDKDLFKYSDYAYAVENAVDSLKELSDGVIGSHDKDSVVKKILEMEGMDYVTL